MRVHRNRVVSEWDGRIEEIPADGATLPVIGHMAMWGQQMELRKFSIFVPMRDATTGDFEEMPLLSGQGVGLVDKIEPVADVIGRMVADAAPAIRHGAAGLAR